MKFFMKGGLSTNTVLQLIALLATLKKSGGEDTTKCLHQDPGYLDTWLKCPVNKQIRIHDILLMHPAGGDTSWSCETITNNQVYSIDKCHIPLSDQRMIIDKSREQCNTKEICSIRFTHRLLTSMCDPQIYRDDVVIISVLFQCLQKSSIPILYPLDPAPPVATEYAVIDLQSQNYPESGTDAQLTNVTFTVTMPTPHTSFTLQVEYLDLSFEQIIPSSSDNSPAYCINVISGEKVMPTCAEKGRAYSPAQPRGYESVDINIRVSNNIRARFWLRLTVLEDTRYSSELLRLSWPSYVGSITTISQVIYTSEKTPAIMTQSQTMIPPTSDPVDPSNSKSMSTNKQSMLESTTTKISNDHFFVTSIPPDTMVTKRKVTGSVDIIKYFTFQNEHDIRNTTWHVDGATSATTSSTKSAVLPPSVKHQQYSPILDRVLIIGGSVGCFIVILLLIAIIAIFCHRAGVKNPEMGYYYDDTLVVDPGNKPDQAISLDIESYNYEDFRIPRSPPRPQKGGIQTKTTPKSANMQSIHHDMDNHANNIKMTQMGNRTGFDEPFSSIPNNKTNGGVNTGSLPTVTSAGQSLNDVTKMYQSMASNLQDLYAMPTKPPVQRFSDTEIVENELYQN